MLNVINLKSNLSMVVLALQPSGDQGNSPLLEPGNISFASVQLGLTSREGFALLFIGGFGVITLIIQGILLFRSNASSVEAVRLTLITLISVLAVIALVLGFDDRQIAPVMALFGSIVGYLLGRGSADDSQKVGKTSEDHV